MQISSWLQFVARGLKPWRVASLLLLLGAGYAGVSCDSSAHTQLQAVRGNECVTCHQTEFVSAAQPPHVDVFPNSCGDCHNNSGWKPAKDFHHERYFALEAAHANVECTACHTKGFSAGDTPSECVGCHRKDYDNSPFPSHSTFPTTCADCHTTTAWKPATIADHDQFFALDGKHVGVECASCHTSGYAAGATPSDCVGCHRKDYDTSPFPNHTTFPTTCANCHTTAGWKPAMLPDHAQFFALDGKHVGVECASCHTAGYSPRATPTACVGCHRKDYDTSPYPGHSGFPTTCADCHKTSGWTPASGGHPETSFPITRGAHTGIACADCHNASLGTAKDNPDCVGCHTGVHSRSRMDSKHREVSRYPTGTAPPNFCLTCHPKGRAD